MTDFTAYGFKADIGAYAETDTRVDRTEPVRLSNIVNVKDWGAVGDGTTDDTDAINAAADFAATLGLPANNVAGAIVFFPPGVYRIGKGGTTALYLDRSNLAGMAYITFQGSGRDVTILRGNYNPGGQQERPDNGFLVQVEIGNPYLTNNPQYSSTTGVHDLTVHNESTGDTSGALINMGSGNNRFFSNCHFIGVTGFACTERSFGLSVRDCLFTCSRTITAASEPAATRSPYYTPSKFLPPSGGFGQITGSVGAYLGEGLFANLHAVGFDIGFSVIGAASVLHGCSATQCGIGVTTGIRNGSFTGGTVLDPAVKPGDWYALSSGEITSCKFDRCTWGIHMYSGAGLFAANTIMGTTGPNVPAAITSLNYGGTTVIITTVDNHNLTGSLTLQIAPASLTDDPDGFVTATVTGAKTFTYIKAATTSFITGCTWNYPLEYGVNCITPNGCTFAANSIDASVSIASFLSAGPGVDSSNDNEVWCTRGPYGWILAPNNSNPFPAGCWTYEMCGGEVDLHRTSTERFPGIPNVRYLPGLQDNIPGHPTTGKERNLITGRATTSSFGDVVCAFLVTSIDAASGTNVLTFASVPSFITSGVGFTVDNFGGHTGTGDNGRTVSSTTGTTVTLGGGNLTATVVAGSRIYFNRFAGSGGAYKVRYDGEAWRRIA